MTWLGRPSQCRPGQIMSYPFEEASFTVTDSMRQVFEWDGCILVKGLFDREEVDNIERGLQYTDAFRKNAFEVSDGSGRNSRYVLWCHPGDDVTGMVPRCRKVAETAEMLLGGEVYHYHSKVMMKQPHTGGRHVWHQDYGYWYKNGCLRPDMLTAYIALDKCVRENGCLQVLQGSHVCGRIEHDRYSGQIMADLKRVEEIKKHFPLVDVIMDPGDCLFFHSNVLHTADRNNSDMRRWTFLCAYNRADNDPVCEHHLPNYTPLHKVANDAVRTCQNYTDLGGKEFLSASSNKNVTARMAETGGH